MCDSAVASSGDLCLRPCRTQRKNWRWGGGDEWKEAENNERKDTKEEWQRKTGQDPEGIKGRVE